MTEQISKNVSDHIDNSLLLIEFNFMQAEARTQSRHDARKPTASGFTTEPATGETTQLIQKKKAQQSEVRTLLNLQMEKKQ